MRERWAKVQGLDPDNLTDEDAKNLYDDYTRSLGADLGPLEANILGPVSAWDHKRLEPHPFVSLYQHEVEMIAGDKTLAPVARVFLAALARSHENGHAPFATKELSEVTGLRYKNALPDAVERAVSAGLLAPESTRRCLVLGRVRRPLSGRQTGSPPCEHSAV